MRTNNNGAGRSSRGKLAESRQPRFSLNSRIIGGTNRRERLTANFSNYGEFLAACCRTSS